MTLSASKHFLLFFLLAYILYIYLIHFILYIITRISKLCLYPKSYFKTSFIYGIILFTTTIYFFFNFSHPFNPSHIIINSSFLYLTNLSTYTSDYNSIYLIEYLIILILMWHDTNISNFIFTYLWTILYLPHLFYLHLITYPLLLLPVISVIISMVWIRYILV